MEEKISVIIPIYQVEKFLTKCIDTIIGQTYQNIEIILVDDGSKDKCPQICDEYAKKDERIKAIHKENGGLSDARNVGIDNATGKYLFFVDSDDWVDKNILLHLYTILKENQADIAECQYGKVYQETDKLANDETEKIIILEPRQALENLVTEEAGNHVVTWNKLYKKELFDHIKFPIGKIHEDEYTTYQIYYQASKIVVTNLQLYYYRQRKGSIISEQFKPKRLDIIQAYEERLQFYKEKEEMELYKLEVARFLYILAYCYYHSKKSKFDKSTINDIKKKYRKYYRDYLKVNQKLSKEKIKYGLINIMPNLIFILPII